MLTNAADDIGLENIGRSQIHPTVIHDRENAIGRFEVFRSDEHQQALLNNELAEFTNQLLINVCQPVTKSPCIADQIQFGILVAAYVQLIHFVDTAWALNIRLKEVSVFFA